MTPAATQQEWPPRSRLLGPAWANSVDALPPATRTAAVRNGTIALIDRMAGSLVEARANSKMGTAPKLYARHKMMCGCVGCKQVPGSRIAWSAFGPHIVLARHCDCAVSTWIARCFGVRSRPYRAERRLNAEGPTVAATARSRIVADSGLLRSTEGSPSEIARARRNSCSINGPRTTARIVGAIGNP